MPYYPFIQPTNPIHLFISNELIIITLQIYIPHHAQMSTRVTLKNKSEYQLYEDDLNEYKNRSRMLPKLQQWNMVQSQVLSPVKGSQDKNGMSKEEKKLYSRQPSHDRLQRIENVQSRSVERRSPQANSYSQQVSNQFGDISPKQKTNQQLQKDIKSMREMLILLNNMVNSKLNKYDLHQFVPKGLMPTNHPQKESELLASQIQLNEKIIEALQKEIKEIKHRDKQLQEKDFLIELQESANQVMSHIRSNKKDKHKGKVTVQKLDSRLLEMREAQIQDEFKMVKVLKHNTLYYYKKTKHNQLIIGDLNRQYNELVEKDNKLNEDYKRFTAMAQQKNMLVKANRPYLEQLKVLGELNKAVEQNKKKVDVVKRSKQVQCEKISSQIDKIKKNLVGLQAKFEEYQIRDHEITNITESVMEKSKVTGKILNKISEKYGDGTSRPPRNTIGQRDSLNLNQKLKQQSLNTSLELNQQYRTLSTKPLAKKPMKSNDKNSRTIQFENDAQKYRIKPSLHIRKHSNGPNNESAPLKNNSQIVDETIAQQDTTK